MKHKLLFLATLLLLYCHAKAHVPIVFEYVVFGEKFPLLRSSKIIQDHNGMLWIGTQEEGLFSYNGVTNKQYVPIPGDSTSLAFRVINDIMEDENGILWLGTRGGIARYDSKTKSFTNTFIKTNSSFQNTVQVVNISSRYVIASAPNTAMYLVSKEKKEPVKPVEIPKTLLNHPEIQIHYPAPIWAQNKEGLWFYFYRDQIYRWDSTNLSIVFVINIPLKSSLGKTKAPSGVVCDERGVFWIVNTDGSINLFNPKTKSIQSLITSDLLSVDENNTVKNPVFAFGKLFIPTGIKGLVTLDTASLSLNRISLGSTNYTFSSLESMLSSDRVLSILNDETGSLWVTTFAGIYKYNPGKVRFAKIESKPSPLDEKDLLTHVINFHELDTFDFLIFDVKGNMWRYNRLTQDIRCITGNKSYNHTNLKGYCAESINADQLLVGTDTGVYIFDLKQNRVIKTIFYEQKITRGASNKVIDILPLDKNTYLLACIQGVILFRVDSLTFSYFQYKNGSKSSRAIGVKNFHKDSKGRIWAASIREGLLFVDVPRQQLIHVLDNIKQDEAFFDPRVMSVTSIGDRFYLGTWGNGLVEIKLPSRFPQNVIGAEKANLEISKLFPSQVVYSAIEDDQGYMWSSTNKGLVKYNLNTGYVRSFDLNDGLQGFEFNMNAYLKASDGCMLFGGISGFNFFNPNNVVSNTATTTPKISELEVFNFESRDSKIYEMLDISVVNLGYRENNIKISFYYPHYMNPSGNQYMYKLEGLDNKWHSLGKSTSVIFNNLSSGQYTFKLKAANADGIWSEKESSFVLTVSYPFWLDWRTYGMALLVSFSSFVLYIGYKNRREQAFKLKLEAEIAQKTNDIQGINASLEKQNQQLKEITEKLEIENKSKDVIFSILSHDLRAPLTTLKGLMNVYQNKNSGLSKDDLFGHMYKLQGSVDNSLQLIDTILYWYHAQGSNMDVKKNPLLLHELVERSVSVYRAVADKKMVFVKIEIDPMLEVNTDEDMMSVVIRNLVSNAVKFSPKGGKVTVISTVTEEVATLCISDQGGGIPTEVIEMIQKRGQAISSKGTLGEKGTGLGLALAFRFCKACDVNLSINSTNNMGTTICLTFPLVSSH